MIAPRTAATTILGTLLLSATVALAGLVPELPPGHEVVWAVLVGALGMLVTIVLGWEAFRTRVGKIADERIETRFPKLLDLHNADISAHSLAADHRHQGMNQILLELKEGQAHIAGMLEARLAAGEKRFDDLDKRIEQVETEARKVEQELEKLIGDEAQMRRRAGDSEDLNIKELRNHGGLRSGRQ